MTDPADHERKPVRKYRRRADALYARRAALPAVSSGRPETDYFPNSPKDSYGLSAEERQFVIQFMVDLSVRSAAERCGIPYDLAKKLMGKRKIQDMIARERNGRLNRTQIYADEVLRRVWMIATADPREIVNIRRVNCRYCWGHDHRHQFTNEELRKAEQEHKSTMMRLPEKLRVPFDDLGGNGFRVNGPPNPECPECGGEGEAKAFIQDTENYSPAAALLYAGVKVSKFGDIDVRLHNQFDALKAVAHYVGLNIQRHAISTLDPAKMTNEQLGDLIENFKHLLNEDEETNRANNAKLVHDPGRPLREEEYNPDYEEDEEEE
jgi:phage terminase small subunit